MHEKQDWRGLVQTIIKIGYEFDLSYYYLAAAANGLGLKVAADKYLVKANELSLIAKTSCESATMIKCTDVKVSNI